METRFDIYQAVTDKIIEKMEQGIIPWQKPWMGGSNCAISYTSRKPYSWLNQMLLGEAGEYLTFNQIKALGGKVKKGAKSRMVVFYTSSNHTKKVEKDEETGEDKVVSVVTEYAFPVLRYYKVFHINDTEGIESKEESVSTSLTPIEDAEKVVKAYVEREDGLTVDVIKSASAYYSPAKDKVVVPELNQYESAEEFYSTLFHELTHSTGIKSRCNRGLEADAGFGSISYSKEELVAEIGSAMALNRIGIDCAKAFNNSVAYIQNWLETLRNDKKLIISASGKAQKAVEYIFGEK